MASWADVCAETGELAALVQASFDAARHKTMATLRVDGSPRISGTETQFVDGDLWLGSMPGSRKAADLRRDPRVAIHSASPDPAPDDPTDWVGDAKLAGVAVEITEASDWDRYLVAIADTMPGAEPGSFDLFRIDVREVVATRVGDPADHLVITMWHEGRGTSTVRR
jgi:hypothetical protein